MKAIIFTSDGFRKDLHVSKEMPHLVTLRMGELHPLLHEVEDQLQVEKIYYRLERSFLNEYDETILIYREMR